MIAYILIHIDALLLIGIAKLHLYWVLGGEWGLLGAIPGQYAEIFMEKKRNLLFLGATLVVCFGLLLFASVILANHYAIPFFSTHAWTPIFTGIIGVIFLLRAIGDFNVCGLFKKKSPTLFAQRDSQIYIPLCLFLGGSALLISIL